MSKPNCWSLVLMIGMASCATNPRQLASREPVFSVRPCPSDLSATRDVVCGSVSVPENYARPAGRRIDLNVVVLRALAPQRAKAAQFDLEGGPGLAVGDSASFYSGEGVAYRTSRDVVLMDMRGTGHSNPLRCSAIEARTKTQPSAPLYPPAMVAECAQQLAGIADVRQYTTAAASRDLDAVRRALGYARIDLYALSYGTTLALRYIADHPGRVRTAVLTGTVPADKTPPAHHAIAAERGLRMLLDACAEDAACARQYPDPWADLDRATAALGPDMAPVFLEKLRTLLYLPATARGVPRFIRLAANGEPELAARSGDGGRVFADGLYLAITCSESLARMDLHRALAESSKTRFGDYRLARQRAACERWPIAPADPDLFRAGRYDVPVLLFSGAMDPVTPTEWSIGVSRRFPNSKLVIVPEGAHLFMGLSGMDTCMDRMILKFVETASVRGIDSSCVADMHRGPFAAP
jgi:pimeloyl-ACP methyl ester carboxylesterase